jgi:hypothetical protein
MSVGLDSNARESLHNLRGIFADDNTVGAIVDTDAPYHQALNDVP